MAEISCRCEEPDAPIDLFERTFLGTDYLFAEVCIDLCRACRRQWLHYHLEYEGFTGSGRWYRGLLPPGAAVTTRNAALVFADLEWYWAGGSRRRGQVVRGAGSIDLDP